MSQFQNIDPAVEAIRPLRHKLRKGDQIFFLHIPKTAGTSLVDVLQAQVKPGEYFSFEDGPAGLTPENIALAQQVRIVRGHRMYDFQKYFTRRPYVITMLRHPVDRVISNYAHLVTLQPARLLVMARQVNPTRDDSPISLEEFIRLPNMQNRLVQFLVGFNGALKQPFTHHLELAKIHLESLACFGLKERFDDSLKLLAYTFDWPPIQQAAHLNIASPDAKPKVTSELRALAEECNTLDMKFYAYACELFEYRFRQMERDLKEQSAR